MYSYIYTCLRVYIFMYVYMSVYIHLYVHEYSADFWEFLPDMYSYIYTYMLAPTYLYMYICLYTYICICICMRITLTFKNFYQLFPHQRYFDVLRMRWVAVHVCLCVTWRMLVCDMTRCYVWHERKKERKTVYVW